MNTGGYSGRDRKAALARGAGFKRAPLARAITLVLTLTAGGMASSAAAAGPRPFSSDWFAVKGATSANTAGASAGILPGMPPLAQQQQANQQLQLSIANLSKTAAAIAAQQAMQAAVRQAALSAPDSVPNGLATGGLQVDTSPATAGWLNASAPTQSTVNGHTTVAINQTQDKAILNWQTFNVGKNTEVDFNQQPTWAVLNRVNDPNARPSEIEGQIKGAGTVMLINRNGILFSGSSQVNVRNLVAAAANIRDSQFDNNGIYGTDSSTPSFTDALGQVQVQSGAQIATNAPNSVTQGGGYVLLLGSEVGNAGQITTGQGQTELAAGDNFVIRTGVGTDSNQASTTRGNEVAPLLAAGSTAGQVSNTGLIVAQQGDITLAGHDVQQNGVAIATTTVNTRGTIHLLNSASDASGLVTLGDGATTAVVIDDDGQTALDSQRSELIANSTAENALRGTTGVFDNLSLLPDQGFQSRIEIVSGGDVVFDGDSLTLATGGQIAVSAKNRSFVADQAQLDVAGAVGVNLAMASNNVAVNIQGNELRDAPLNRDGGDLLNANVWIDKRDLIDVPAGTGGDASERWYTSDGLLEVSGYLANQDHGIGEWAAQGGTIMLSGGQVITQQGSSVNLSGGSLNVQTGYLNQTWLTGSDGRLYNINQAPANMLFAGVYQGFEEAHPRWGADTTEYFLNPLIGPQRVLQNGYTAGRDAGQLIVSAPTAVLEGDIVDAVYNGPRQTQARDADITDGYLQSQNAVALAGGLLVGEYTNAGLYAAFTSDVKIDDIADITQNMAATDTLDAQRLDTVWLDAPMLDSQHLGELSMNTGGQIQVNEPLSLDNGGQLNLAAPVVAINADITAHSGSVTITNIFKQGGGGSFPLTAATGLPQLTLASGVTIDVQGLWSNLPLDPNSLSGLAYVNGGNVDFDSTQNVLLADGSVINVSSGGAILANGQTQGGKGGDVTLVAGDTNGNATQPGANITLNGAIRAYGVNGGGTLSMSSPATVAIGADASLSGGVLAAGTPAPIALTLAQPVTIPAGQPLPMSLTQSFTSVVFGAPVPVDVTLGVAPSAPTGADWVVPSGLYVWSVSNQLWGAGQTVPAGTRISGWAGSEKIPAGTIIPVGVFPDGLPVKPFSVSYAAGTVMSTAATYTAGTQIQSGVSFGQAIAIQPPEELDQNFFSSGFSSYNINGGNGILISAGTQIAPVMPVYQLSAAGLSVATGSDPSSALSVWLPALFTGNPISATLTQRGGASLTLQSLISPGGIVSGGGSIDLADGASITVDPGQSIKLAAFGQITVDGDLTAHNGSIDLTGEAIGDQDASRNFDAAGNGRGVSLWVGPDAVLDVSGQAYSALDSFDRRYGVAANGGAISLDSATAFVIIRPGAELDADGAAVTVDSAAGFGPKATDSAQTLAGNGGSIELSSDSGLYLDGKLHALAGGAAAAGGSLSVSLLTPGYVYGSGQSAPTVDGLIVPSVMTVQQAQSTLLTGDIAPGADAAALVFGQTTVSADQVAAGGFGTLSLYSGDYMQFAGDVSLALAQSLTLSASAFTSGPAVVGATNLSLPPAAGSVRVSAPYILLQANPVAISDIDTSASIRNPGPALSPTTASFEADADQLDIQGLVVFSAKANYSDPATNSNVSASAPGFLTTKLVSQGDIRFLSTSAAAQTLESPWNIELDAAQIYPATGVKASIFAGFTNPNYDATLVIGRTTGQIPAAPLSAFGSLTFSAPVIEQGGIVRAPFGQIILGSDSYFVNPIETETLDLLPGSLTSVSMAGVTMPYGGTVDGVSYTYNGTAVSSPLLTDFNINGVPNYGIVLDAQSIDVENSAVLDLLGGGTLAGAGFISGRGGSVNILTTPLVNANPTTPSSKATDQVYAIVPGYASGYAPKAPENGAGDPAIGQQITLPAGVPGLPAGTYTLLPSNYALLPGAYRVELGAAVATPMAAPTPIGNGTYVAAGYLGIANTGVKNALPSLTLVTPGTAVRSYSQYNEEDYSDFLTANTAQFGALTPLLPADGSTLLLSFVPPVGSKAAPSLTFDGAALLQAGPGGFAGQVNVENVGEIYADTPTPGFSGLAVNAAALDAINAPRLTINGYLNILNDMIVFDNVGGNLSIADGVTLKAAELFLVGGDITIGDDVTLTTIGQGAVPYDSVSTGLSYSAGTSTVLALSNGELDFLGSQGGTGSITVGGGSALYAGDTLVFATNGQSTIDPDAHFGARNISLAVGSINIGADANGTGAVGMAFSQSLLDTLINGDPPLATLTISAADSINLFGDASLDARGSGVDLVLDTPAIYGYGAAGDQATIAAGKITWNGIDGATPPAIAANGPQLGAGALNLIADEIDFGNFVSLDTTSTNRTIYGFDNVNLTAGDQIVAAGHTSLFVYQAPSTAAGAVFGQSGTGGNLTLLTPLLTGAQMSVATYTAGGALAVTSPDGIAPSAATSTVAGAEIDLSGDSVAIGSTILLPSGKLVVNATQDIALNAGSRIDLSGRPSQIQSATVYGFGGAAIFDSTQGGFSQADGSDIDVSAIHADAGSIAINAGNGAVSLAGNLLGATDAGQTSGDFSVTAGTLNDFAGLNAALTRGGFFDARSFDLKHGDLIIGDGVQAHAVTVSLDGGSLTVDGTIDAGGANPGAIRLSAMNGLTLAAGADLDASGSVLQVDSYGQPVAAENRGTVELTATQGLLTLSPGATIDLSTPDGVAYGQITLNAPRTGETSGDIDINATGPLTLRGAQSIALNAMWTYDLPGGSVITQTTLDGYDASSQTFINAALGNTGLQTRLAGLTGYGSAFHLRPGVEITSSGSLSTSGDIDLSGYRYGPDADRDIASADYGAGEPMDLVIRAAGNLSINGSISDGFGYLPATTAVPPIYSGIVAPGTVLTSDFVFNTTIYFTTSWVVPEDDYYVNIVEYLTDYTTNIDYYPGDTVPAGAQFKADTYNAFEAGVTLPGYATGIAVPGTVAKPAVPGTSAMAPMLAAGSLSASLQLVAGADLAAADPRGLQTPQVLNGGGNLTLGDPAYGPSQNGAFYSVLRTGTGNLDLLAGGSFSEATPYGVYTAGTQAAPILAANGSNPYDAIATSSSGGQAWYPEDGGDLLLMAQQTVTGDIQIANNTTRNADSDLIANWLWRQGGGGMTADPTAWWINFGTTAPTSLYETAQGLIGFQGIGTLGGGNLTVIAGGNAGAGVLNGADSSGLDLAVAATGRVRADGSLVETGGGELTLKIGGTLNPMAPLSATSLPPDYFGSVTDLRGDITINAGAIGAIAQNFRAAAWTSDDPRTLDPATIKRAIETPGPAVTPGDGTVDVTTRGDLVFGGANDAGMAIPVDLNGIPYSLINADGSTTFVDSGGQSSFSLWTANTAIDLYSAGGDVSPQVDGGFNNSSQNANGLYPGTLMVAAANGDIRFAEPTSPSDTPPVLELMPAATGQLELLAAGSIYGSDQVVAMSGAEVSSLATPFHPVFNTLVGGGGATNAAVDSAYVGGSDSGLTPIAFGEDTPTADQHADDSSPALIYAGTDIDDLILGQQQSKRINNGSGFVPADTTWYLAAKPFEVIAGRDIVGTGTTPDVFVNNGANDITLFQAGRDIIYQSITIAGPGLLDVQAGRNLYQGYYGTLESVGPLYNINIDNRDGGAGIVAVTGVGANGPDYADFARLYFDPANQLPAGTPLAGSGKVVETYAGQLYAWLQQRFGYAGSEDDALAYFLSLPGDQQGVFVRQVYYQELTAAGREETGALASPRLGSYLRGREAIAALFPAQDAQGHPITYSGGLTMFSSITGTDFINGQSVPHVTDAGIHTDFGGSIQILDPGGQTLVGVEGVTPGAQSGLITQGSGDIDIYSLGSILLGESRIMTTFGGNILAWSAEGDINAGRGSKTTVLYTPPRRVYDDYGDVTLSPSVPSTGAGIATLAPLPEVPAGDVDLVAPLGTIDAGEAGIRVSGNVNVAALRVLNSANIQVQGTSTGLPTVAAVNVGALTAASQAASSAVQATELLSRQAQANQPSIISVEILGYGSQQLGAGGDEADSTTRNLAQPITEVMPYNTVNPVQIAGLGEKIDPQLWDRLSPEERQALQQDR